MTQYAILILDYTRKEKIMIDLILIIMLIVSLAKPDILLSKKMKEKATDEQKNILTKNLNI